MRDTEFYQGHLDRVSRSFAFCIQKLEPPFRLWVSLSYLLCRVLDTVEDAAWSAKALQDEQYARFNSFLERLPIREDVARWASEFPTSLPEGEKLVLEDAYDLFQDLHGLQDPVRATMRDTIGKMRRGMQYYSQRTHHGPLRLTDLTDVNRYCYFVAGVVGELLSRLYVIYRPEFRVPRDFHTNALHFGLFLQKVNLLKDQRIDEREGRYLVPHRQSLLASLRKNAEGALSYLLSLPESEAGFRTFCGWSLFLGAASLPWMQKAYEAMDGTKIPRSVTRELLAAVENVVLDNTALRGAFDEYLSLMSSTTPEEGGAAVAPDRGAIQPQDGLWFLHLTGGSLEREELAELGMA